MIIDSNVPGHRGKCRPVWLNRNRVCQRLDGGVTGFFRLVRKRYGFWFRHGPEFHGIVRNGCVELTNRDCRERTRLVINPVTRDQSGHVSRRFGQIERDRARRRHPARFHDRREGH